MSTSSTSGSPELPHGSSGPSPAQMPPGQMPPGQAPQYQMQPGQAPQYQMQPGQMPQQQPPTGQLVVNVRPAFGLGLSWTSKVCLVNGYQVPTRNGPNGIVVAPGQHHVELYSSYMRKYGHAAIDVYVPPNGVTHVFYTEPATQFHSKANIGFVQQPTAGKRSTLILFGLFVAVPIVLTFAIVLVSVLS